MNAEPRAAPAVVVQSMGGSNLLPTNPGRRARGILTLFEIVHGAAHQTAVAPSGEAAQGIVFAADNKTVLVQFNVEKAIAIYTVRGRRLVDTGERLSVSAGPASIRSTPR